MQRILTHFGDLGKRAETVLRRVVNSLQNKDIFVVLVTILVAFGSFGLGRLSKIEEKREPIRVENLSQEAAVMAPRASQANRQVVAEKGKYVASKNGAKYYLPWCSGVSKISEANKIWFQSKEEAEARGLTPAANCPGI